MGIRRSDPVLLIARRAAAVAGVLVLASCASVPEVCQPVDAQIWVFLEPPVVEFGETGAKAWHLTASASRYVRGRIYVPEEDSDYSEEGMASLVMAMISTAG